MRAIDLYALTRKIPEELRASFEKNLSRRSGKLRVKAQEFEQIRRIVEELRQIGAERECYEDWFYSFTIPHISREFDLLKVGENECVVNLELKTASPSVTLSRVKKQLERNAYYLSLIAKKIYSFTYVGDGSDGGCLYTLKDGALKKCSFQELRNKILRVKTPVRERIDEMFHPGEYLISPFSEPERFCAGQYFLTEHQQQMKEKIVTGISRSRALLWGITGEAGTGKTLLLYDVARTLSSGYTVGVFHCGKLSEGHQKLKDMLTGIDILEADDMDPDISEENSGRDPAPAGEKISGVDEEKTPERSVSDCEEDRIGRYDIICVDETQRIRAEELEKIITAYETGRIKACIFIYDLKQVLSKSELERNTPERLKGLPGFTELSLTKTIRTSKEIYAFINVMMDLKKRSSLLFPEIDLLWAENEEETEALLESYGKKGYRFISMPVYEAGGEEKRIWKKNRDYSHDVIGLEFDAVSVVLDGRFRYDSSGHLIGTESPEEDYLYVQMLYQNVSRAKERLCVIVQGNEGVFRELIRVMD